MEGWKERRTEGQLSPSQFQQGLTRTTAHEGQ